MSKYFSRKGHNLTVITTTKKPVDGPFTEKFPEKIDVIELNSFGSQRPSVEAWSSDVPYANSRRGKIFRQFKDAVMSWMGQLPDPRLPFALSFASPFLGTAAVDALRNADIVVATTPPWPPLLAAIFVKWRFGKPIILDYRDQFSRCHEMPGGKLAKAIEVHVDRFLAKRADSVVTISPPMGEYYSGFNPNLSVIMNGYDPEAVDSAKLRAPWTSRTPGTPLVVRYLGQVSHGRIPRKMLDAVVRLQGAEKLSPGMVNFEFYGEAHKLRDALETTYPTVKDYFVFHPRVAYERSLELATSADHLLFCENSVAPRAGEAKSAQGILTTKLFEYMASGRPIIAHIHPQALAGSFIAKASADHFVSSEADDFVRLFQSDQFWEPKPVQPTPFVETLSRAAQADAYLAVIGDVVEGAAQPVR